MHQTVSLASTRVCELGYEAVQLLCHLDTKHPLTVAKCRLIMSPPFNEPINLSPGLHCADSAR